MEMCDGEHRAIETLEVGELVRAWDEVTGESGCRAVAETFARGTEMLLALDIENEGGQVERVVTTGEHPFYRPELERFVRAEELAAGDALLSSSGSWLKVGSATWVQQSATVYNLTVDGFHTYFVGLGGVWVHNKAAYRPNAVASKPNRKPNLKPDPDATGPHTTMKYNSEGKITNYEEWSVNPRNPSGFDSVKRVDTQYANPHPHMNKDGVKVYSPHVHEKGDVRPALSWELPQ